MGWQEAQLAQGSARARRQRVLVIDDNATIVELIRHAITMQGHYDVSVAYDGIQGLELFTREQPDCVVVDVKMPRMDGYQVVRAIRADPRQARVPLIVLSALSDEDGRLTGLLPGVDEYIGKPFKPSVLCAALDRALRFASPAVQPAASRAGTEGTAS